MNKSELIASVAEKTGLMKKDLTAAVDATLATIIDSVSNGDDVQLIGFGTFTVSERAARTGRNPATGETMQIAASKAPKFKAGKAFKDKVNS